MSRKGRPNKYESHVKPRFAEIKEWLQAGATDKEIADNLGVNPKVFCKYKKEFNDLNELWLNTKKTIAALLINEKKWCVYIHTFPNKKKYVGITCRKPEERWQNGKGYGKQTYVRSAIEKYGWENVKHEVLYRDLTEAEAKAKEVELIEKYQTCLPSYGYNLTKGGDGHSVTPEQIHEANMRRRTFGSVMFAKDISDILDNLSTVSELSEKGFTKDEISNVMGVSRTTWYEWEKQEPRIKEAVNAGRVKAVQEIKAALFKRATGFTYTEKKVIESEKNGRTVETYEKAALPDPTSALILLKHWDKDSGWTQDPQQLELKKKELELKEKKLESEDW